jgi:hypothetical protein
MITPRPIKGLVHEAITFLEASYFVERRGHFHRPLVSPLDSNLFLLPCQELIALCDSQEKTNALLLANVVMRLALVKKIPTLLVSVRHSLVVLTVNLLLCRAGINLEEAINPDWDEYDFARLTVASAELAAAPLVLVRGMPFSMLKNAAHDAVKTCQTRWMIMDLVETGSFGQLSKLSRKLGLQITVASTASVSRWRRASGRRSTRNGVD